MRDGRFVAGIDIGSATTKVVLLRADEVLGSVLLETVPDGAGTALDKALSAGKFGREEMACLVATGYGRINVPFADKVVTEIACHARGVHYNFPAARTVLDMGGQDCKAIRVGEGGRHLDFVMNDKCAAGTGRFLEVMARTLRVPIEELGPLSLESAQPVEISNICAVFARSEVIRYLRRGVPKADIAAGLHEATANRVVALLRRIGVEEELVISGGIGKNIGVVSRVESKLGLRARIPEEPQLIGALGAALFARDALDGGW